MGVLRALVQQARERRRGRVEHLKPIQFKAADHLHIVPAEQPLAVDRIVVQQRADPAEG